MSMKITIAAWHLKDFNVGLARYCRGLIEAIGRVDHENRYEILMPEAAYRFPERPNLRYRVIRFPVFKRRFWEQVAPLLVGPYDLLHFPYDSGIAWKRGKFVVTVHDVKPLLFDSPRPRRNLNSLVEQLAVGDKWSKVDRVVTDSESSRRDIVEHLKIHKERVAVAYPGVDRELFRPAPAATADRGARPYVLCVAGSDPTKNVETLIDAFAQLPLTVRDTHDLVLVGDFRRRSDLYERVRQTGIEKQTLFTGIVSDDRMIELYQRAILFVF